MTRIKRYSYQLILTTLVLSPLLVSPVFAQPDSPDKSASKPPETQKPDNSKFSEPEKLLVDGKYAQAKDKLEILLKDFKLNTDTVNTLKTYELLALAQAKCYRYIDAQRSLKFAMGMNTALPDTVEAQSTKSRILFHLADLECELGLYESAASTTKRGLESVRGNIVAGRMPYTECELLNLQALVLALQGNPKEAQEPLQEASYIVDALQDPPSEKMVPASKISRNKVFMQAKILVTRAHVKHYEGNQKESKKFANEATTLFKKYTEDALNDPRYAKYLFLADPVDPELIKKANQKDSLIKATYLEVQSDKKAALSKYKQAIDLLSQSLDIKSKLLERNSATIGTTKVKLADLYLKSGDSLKAATLASQGYQALTRAVPKSSPMLASSIAILAKAYLAKGQTDGVERLLIHAWRLEAKRMGPNSPEVFELINALSLFYLRTKSYKKAAQYSIPMLPKMEAEYGKYSLKLVPTLTTGGSALAQLRKCKRARPLLAKAKSILEKNGKSKTAQYGEVLASIGINETYDYKWKIAKGNLQRAISLYKNVYGENHPNTLHMKKLYKAMYKKRNYIPGSNKNLLLHGVGRLRPTDHYGK